MTITKVTHRALMRYFVDAVEAELAMYLCQSDGFMGAFQHFYELVDVHLDGMFALVGELFGESSFEVNLK